MSKNYLILEKTKLPGSQLEIKAEISLNFLSISREKALKKFQEKTELPGFRKGNVPTNIIVQRLGEYTILEEAANISIEEIWLDVLKEVPERIIGSPSVSITKLAIGNPLEFKITATLLPEFSLPDYIQIAKGVMSKAEDISVTEKEIDDVVMEIRKHDAHMDIHKKSGSDSHDHAPVTKSDLPELTDDLVKKFGDFKDISDFKEKIRQNLLEDKTHRTREKKRMSVLEAIIEKTSIDVPQILVDDELAKMTARFKDDVMRAGLTFENYLTTVKKTEEEIKKEWKPLAEKNARVQLVVNQIAVEEKLLPDSARLESEASKIMEQHSDADPSRVRMFVAMQLTNEKVLEFLEKQK
jgi:FKBP-type peptidyl-prolyl cis-trans isomerase (trigger factor)